MREILFSGKRVDNGEWVEGWLYKRYMYPDKMVDAIQVYDGSDFGNVEYHPVVAETIGQYTGLTDKNGKRIFEGDIVHYRYEPGKGFWNADQLSVIKWSKTGYSFEGIMGTNKYALMCGCLSSVPFNQDAKNIPEFEVIGNIHDNPELLAEVQEGEIENG